jgi:NAD+ synthase
MYFFDAKQAKNDIVEWIRQWFEHNGKGCNAVLGISGGKDSSIAAALCVEALGKDRVIGVTMPNSVQVTPDAYNETMNAVKDVVDSLGIVCLNVPIHTPYCTLIDSIDGILSANNLGVGKISEQSRVNLAPRLRMATLYADSQSCNGRVVNTCNLSEDWVGYSTRWGDSVGDFAPLQDFTVTELKQIGYELKHLLPKHLVDRTPTDDLCGKTDEDNFGFTYAVLDKYIRTGICENPAIKALIDAKHEKNLFKMKPIPKFEYR